MKVLKFGGSSVANSKNIEKVLNIVANSSAEQSVVVVVSALGKTTNALIKGATLAAQKNEEYLKIVQRRKTKIINRLNCVLQKFRANPSQV